MGFTPEQGRQYQLNCERGRNAKKADFVAAQPGEPTVKESLTVPKPAKRIRQSSKGLNKLESEQFEWLKKWHPYAVIRPHALTFVLANGVRYTPDFTSPGVRLESDDTLLPTAWEVKGKHAWDDAIVKLKVAASVFPEYRWILVSKPDGVWREQVILP